MESRAFLQDLLEEILQETTALYRYKLRKSAVFGVFHTRHRFVQFSGPFTKNSPSEPLFGQKKHLIPETPRRDTLAGLRNVTNSSERIQPTEPPLGGCGVWIGENENKGSFSCRPRKSSASATDFLSLWTSENVTNSSEETQGQSPVYRAVGLGIRE